MSAILRETLHEIAARPAAFAAEVLQFAVLVVIVWQLVRRALLGKLAERRQQIATRVAQANHAGELHADAERRAAALVEQARAQARSTEDAAAAAARDARQAGMAALERDVEAVVHQAEHAVEAEKIRVTREASERLVALIAVVVHRFLDEAVTESERRTLTQKLIVERMRELAP